jgi:hypothetical protein
MQVTLHRGLVSSSLHINFKKKKLEDAVGQGAGLVDSQATHACMRL